MRHGSEGPSGAPGPFPAPPVGRHPEAGTPPKLTGTCGPHCGQPALHFVILVFQQMAVNPPNPCRRTF